MNVLKPALSISILIHFLYIIGIVSFAYFNNMILSSTALLLGEIPILLLFSTLVFIGNYQLDLTGY